MTKLLDQAITEVQKLADAEQDAIAALILDRIADDQAWERSFARSQNQLAAMAQKARDQVLLIVGRKVGNALIVGNEEFHGHEDDPPESTGIGSQGDAE